MSLADNDRRFNEIAGTEDPDRRDLLDALELIWHRLQRIEGKIDDLEDGFDG